MHILAMSIFQCVGIAVCALLAFLLIAFAGLKLYFTLLHGRFELILFRRTQMRLSLASWYGVKVKPIAGHDPDPNLFSFDDWPINERPFYLSYRIGRCRPFIMIGMLEGPRFNAGKGKHPANPERKE